MPTQEQAEKAWKHGNKGKQYYDAMTEEQKKAMWQYGFDRKLVDTSKLGPGAKAEYQKYVNPDKPEYAMQASIVEKPKQYIQTQNEKITSAITPGIVKNMLGQNPQQIAAKRVETPKVLTTADKRRLLNERNLGKYDPQEKVQTTGKAGLTKVPTDSKTMIPVGKAGILKTQARDFNGIDAALLGALDSTTLGALNIKDDAAIQDHKGAFTAGQVAGYIAPGAALTNAAGKGLAKLGAGKLLQNLGGSAIAGAAIDTGQGLVAGDTGKELAKRVGRGAVIGLAADGALMGIGKIGQGIMKKLADKQALSTAEKAAIDKLPDKAKKEIILYIDTYGNVRKTPTTDLLLEAPQKAGLPKAKNIKTALQNVEVPANIQSKGRAYGIANTNYDKAVQEYNNAIETIQNYYGTNELRASEYSKIKSELGIDIERLVSNIENAQAPNISRIGERERLKAASGLKTLPDLAPVERIPQQVKPNKPIQSALDARLNKPYIANDNRMTDDAIIASKKKLGLPTAEQARIEGVKPPIANQGTLSPLAQKAFVEPPVKPQGALGNAAQTAKEAVSKAPIKKDISGFQAYTTDVYRNFEKVFGEDYAAVKKDILDPFDNAKKAKTIEDRQLMGNLKKNIVDKFNIQKGSKDSALVQKFGEKRLSYESLVDEVGKAKADNIVAADKWFRSEYDRLIDEVNTARAAVYPNNPEKLIPHRTDYYRHFKELSNDFEGLKNIFETPSQISPSLAGTSEFTKPKSKFLSFAQKRGNGAFTDDAVGGFLDYINAATYAKHIDTQIPKFRGLAADLAESTEKSKNMNNFIGYLTDFANDLSGKTNPADRFVQKIIPGGRTTFKALNWLNSRVKANTVLGNLSSSLSQIANIPQGIAYVKNPVHLSKGAGNYMASIFGKGDADIYKKSGFLLERYADNVARQFDVKILDQPKKAAAWMLGAMDEIGTKSIWSSVYQKALADGVGSPIKYADDVTRKLVAGRGIGEVPLLQKSKVMQLIAPFTVEVNNLWKVQKDFIKAKDFGGLALLYLANFALNKGMEEVRGNGVVFDPIQAMYDAATEKDLKPVERAGRLGGEVLSNMPLGSTLAGLYPEQGINNEFGSTPTREKLFGRNDPTRFGSGLLVSKGLQDPYKILPPFGGGQLKKTVQAGQDLGIIPRLKKEEGKILPKLEKQDIPASYSNTKQGDRMRTTINPTLPTTLKGLAFGRGAIPELKKYYESGKVPLGTTQTANIKKLIDKGYDPNKLFETLNEIRGTTKKADIVVKLRQSGYTNNQITEIWEIFYK
jgi:hypothetical protein